MTLVGKELSIFVKDDVYMANTVRQVYGSRLAQVFKTFLLSNLCNHILVKVFKRLFLLKSWIKQIHTCNENKYLCGILLQYF